MKMQVAHAILVSTPPAGGYSTDDGVNANCLAANVSVLSVAAAAAAAAVAASRDATAAVAASRDATAAVGRELLQPPNSPAPPAAGSDISAAAAGWNVTSAPLACLGSSGGELEPTRHQPNVDFGASAAIRQSGDDDDDVYGVSVGLEVRLHKYRGHVLGYIEPQTVSHFSNVAPFSSNSQYTHAWFNS